ETSDFGGQCQSRTPRKSRGLLTHATPRCNTAAAADSGGNIEIEGCDCLLFSPAYSCGGVFANCPCGHPGRAKREPGPIFPRIPAARWVPALALRARPG